MNKWEKTLDDVKRTGGIVPPVEEGDPVVAVYDECGRARVRTAKWENATGVVINVTTGHFRIPDPSEGDLVVGPARQVGCLDNTGGRPPPEPEPKLEPMGWEKSLEWFCDPGFSDPDRVNVWDAFPETDHDHEGCHECAERLARFAAELADRYSPFCEEHRSHLCGCEIQKIWEESSK